jgi:hypothetical protein
MRLSALAAVAAHGLVGWALCGATMGIGMATMPLEHALILHALAVPFIFAAVTFSYFRWFGKWSPLRTAASFLAIVILLDAAVVALLIERSFAMFLSPLGTWLPFALIFLSSWLTGATLRRNAHRESVTPRRPPSE